MRESGTAAKDRGAVVVVPVYRPNPSEDEALSLIQCCKVLGGYPLAFVCAEDFDPHPYLDICGREGCAASVETFDPRFFGSVDSYNRMLFDPAFYRRFECYGHMLVHQLDAYVFRDELADWCGRGYDYVGAPWFERFSESTADDAIIAMGGNGGLSLRRTAAFIRALEAPFPKTRIKTWGDIWREHWTPGLKLRKKIAHFRVLLDKYLCPSNLYSSHISNPQMFEDWFISTVVPRAFPKFKLAPASIGMKFAFECQPRRLYELNGRTLPFGCHAWERYDRAFWENFIPCHSNR